MDARKQEDWIGVRLEAEVTGLRGTLPAVLDLYLTTLAHVLLVPLSKTR